MSCLLEKYITCNLPRIHRSLLAQFRAGILPINVEIGRFRNLPLEDRVCKLCNSVTNNIEDEFHVLCVCNAYNDIRTSLYNNISDINSNFDEYDDFEKFVFINNEYQVQLANFLLKAREIRKTVSFCYLDVIYLSTKME